MTAVVVDQSSPAAVGSDTTAATTASFTPRANTLLVALCCVGNSTGASQVTGAVTDSLSSTWTLVRRYNVTAKGAEEVWVMNAGSSPAARTVTLTGQQANAKGTLLAVQVLSNGRLSTSYDIPVGVTSNQASGTTATTILTPNATGSLTYFLTAYNGGNIAFTGITTTPTTVVATYGDATNGEAYGITRSTIPNVAGTAINAGFSNTVTTGNYASLLVDFVPVDASQVATKLFPVTAAADAAVTAGSGTKKKMLWAPLGAPNVVTTQVNTNTVTGSTTGIQATDSATGGTNGTALSFFSAPVKAVTIAGAITCVVYGSESNLSANAAPCFDLERCSANGTALSKIVDHTTSGSQAATEFSTGFSTKSCAVSAATTTDTTLVDGDRLKVTWFFDDAADQGGTGTMASGFFVTVNYDSWGNTCSLTCAESLTEVVTATPPGTTLYLTQDAPVAAAGGSVYINKAASPTAPTGTTTTSYVATSATPTVQFTNSTTAGGSNQIWLSEPLDAQTIAGNVAWGLFGLESSGTANAAILPGVWRMANDGTFIASISAPGSALPGELATSSTLRQGSLNLTSTAFSAGDRLAIVLFADSAANQAGTGAMAAAFNCVVSYGGSSVAAPAFTFSQTLTFQTGQMLAGSASALTITSSSGALDASGSSASLAGSVAALTITKNSGTAAGTGSVTVGGNASALAITTATGSLSPTPAAALAGSASAVVVTAASGSLAASGSVSVAGSVAALAITKNSGSATPSGSSSLPGSGSALTISANSGTATASGAVSLAGSAAGLVLLAYSGTAQTGASGQQLLGSASALSLSAASGALAPSGTANLVGSSSTVALAAASGALAPTGQAMLQGNGANRTLVSASGGLTPTGSGTLLGSSAVVALAAGSGALSGTGSASLLGSSAAIVMTRYSGFCVGTGETAVQGSASQVLLSTASGVLGGTGSAQAQGSSAAVTLLASSGSIHGTGSISLIGSDAHLGITTASGTLRHGIAADFAINVGPVEMSFVVVTPDPEGDPYTVYATPVPMPLTVQNARPTGQALNLALTDGYTFEFIWPPAVVFLGDYVLADPVPMRLHVQGVGSDNYTWPVEMNLDIGNASTMRGILVETEPVQLVLTVVRARHTGGSSKPFMRPVRLMASSDEADAANLELAWPK